MWVARLLRCQGSAACIIATTWPPESPLRTSQDKVENEPWEKCARRALAASHHRNRVGPQQRNALSHRAKSRSKLSPSPSIMPLMCPGGILARHNLLFSRNSPPKLFPLPKAKSLLRPDGVLARPVSNGLRLAAPDPPHCSGRSSTNASPATQLNWSISGSAKKPAFIALGKRDINRDCTTSATPSPSSGLSLGTARASTCSDCCRTSPPILDIAGSRTLPDTSP